LSVDATTLFGLRPPELSFVRQQGLYHKWFKRQHIQLTHEQQKNYVESLNEYITQALSFRYHKCQWIDATSMIVKIREAALPSVIAYVQNAPTEDFGRGSEKHTVLHFFEKLYRNTQIENSGGF